MKIERKTHTIDATGQVLGRLATKIAGLLRGKGKPGFQPYLDQGDYVIVKNVAEIKVTGNKMQEKVYWRHSGYPGGLKKIKMADLFKIRPSEVLRRAVYNMLPKNKLRNETIKRLKIE